MLETIVIPVTLVLSAIFVITASLLSLKEARILVKK